MDYFHRLYLFLPIACIIFVSGCGTLGQPRIEDIENLGEDVMENTINTVTATAGAARHVTSSTGSFTEGILVVSTDFVKVVILSMDGLRKKGIDVIGPKQKQKTSGSIIIPCPYCKKDVNIGNFSARKPRNRATCPHCSNEFLINYVDEE